MKIFEIGADRRLHSVSEEGPSPGWFHDGVVRWIAGRASELSGVEKLCESCGFELSPQFMEVIRKPSAWPRVIHSENLLLISCPVGAHCPSRRILALCSSSTIMTFHDSDFIEKAELNGPYDRHLCEQTPFALLVELIDDSLQELTSFAFRLRSELVVLTDGLDTGTKQLDSNEHLALKQEATNLEIQLEDHLYCMSELAKLEFETVNSTFVSERILQLGADLDRGLETVGRLRSRIEDLHQFQVRLADETTNRRLKVLTILSAIYLPPTLIAGIYGMNFPNIPITSAFGGYAIVLAIMAVVVVGQLVFFYKRGWFK